MPGAKAYNAGTIFLQVVPVFGDLQREISREAKNANRALGDDMEKGGRDAGRRASKALGEELGKGGKEAAEKYSGAFATSFRDRMRNLNRELAPIKIEVEDEDVQRTFESIKARAKALRNVKIGVDVTSREAARELAALELQLRLLHEQARDIEVKANLKAARTQMASFVKEIQTAHPEMKIEADFNEAKRELGAFQKDFQARMKKAASQLGDSINPELRRLKTEMAELGDMEIGVDISDEDAKSAVRYLKAQLASMDDDKTLEIHAKANIATAMASLELLDARIREIDGTEIDINTGRVKRNIGDAADNFRALNFVLLGAVTLIPALIPLIAALGGALLALGPAIAGVGAGFGVMMLGFSGIGDAVKAMGKKSDDGAKQAEASAKRIRNAGRSIADAERGLTRTRQDAAQRNADAARAVADAERASAEGVRNALRVRADAVRDAAAADRDAAKAQRDLREARREAKADLEDTKDSLAQNKLDERQAVVDLFNATVTDQTVRQDGASTNLEKEQAAINLENARLRLKNIREEQKELGKRAKAGVEGTDRVQSAQDALTSALERQREAHRRVGEASQAVNQARVEGARQVARAVEAQRRAEVDGAQSVADAQRALTRAQEDYQDALHEVPPAVQEIETAMSKLSPAGQRFARFLYGLRDEFYAIRNAAQEGMLPGVQAAISTILTKNGPLIMAFVKSMSGAIGAIFRQFGKMMTNPLWTQFFGMLTELGPKFMRQFATAAMNWLSVFARILIIAAPWAEKFSEALLALSEHALKFVESKKGTQLIQDFLAFAFKVGPHVVDFFVALWGAFVNLSKALAPVGLLLMEAITSVLDFIANMDPKVLGAIAVGIITLVVAFQVLNGIVALTSVGMQLFFIITTTWLRPVLLVAGGIILLVGILIALYTQSDTAKKIIDAAFRAIGKAGKWLWENALRPALNAIWWAIQKLWQGIKWAWESVLQPVFSAIGRLIGWLWEKAFKPALTNIGNFFASTFRVMKWVWNNILWPVLDLAGTVIWNLWKLYFKTALTAIKLAWEALSTGLKWTWQHVIKPIFDAFMDVIGNDMVNRTRNAIEAIGNLWEGLKNLVAAPVRFVIEEVLNKGIIAGFNKIARFVGTKEMGEIPVPGFAKKKRSQGKIDIPSNPGKGALDARAATGGILPGWTPGRDVHHFVSPTGGRLHLSGGEAVMRPEWTAAVGPDMINRWNAIARKHGVNGLRKAMGFGDARFAKGGVFWPVPGRRTSTYAGHDGVDINRGSGWADYGDPIRAFRSGRITYVGTGKGYGRAIFLDADNGPTVVMGHTSAAFVRAGQHVSAGQLLGRVGNTGNSSAPHLHFGIPGGSYSQALALLRGAVLPDGSSTGGGGGFSLPGWIKGVLGKPLGWVKKLAEKGLDKLSDRFGDNGLVKMMTGAARKVVGFVGDKVRDLLGGITGDAGADVAATGSAQKIVKAMAAARGWVGSQWAALKEIVQRESGWNPNAANPTSSARGLFQKMTSIHGPIEGTVKGQALWGLNYIASRYGNPSKALSFWDANGYYADGGIIGSTTGSSSDLGGDSGGVANNGTMMYDSGGYLPPGLTTVLNLTGKPEPVFTADQFANLSNGGGLGGGITYAPTFNGSDLTASDIAEDMNFAFRDLPKRGKYSGKDA